MPSHPSSPCLIRKIEDVRCFTDILQRISVIFTFFLIFCDIIFLIFAQQAILNWITAAGTILTCLLIFGALSLLKKLVVFVHKKYKTGQLERYKCNLLIGIGGYALCGIIPCIAVFFISYNPFMYYNCLTVSSVAAFILYCLFVFERNRVWTIDYGNHWKQIVISIVVQIIFLIALARIGYSYEEQNFKDAIMLCQTFCTCLFTPVIIDFGIVLLGGLKLKNQNGAANVKLQSVKVDQPKRDVCNCQSSLTTLASSAIVTYPRQECKMCVLEYSGTVIPRILTECGHTVCEGCADELLINNNQIYLRCPFCQEITVVNGFASSLTKNFTIIDMIDEKKKNKNDNGFGW